MPKLNLEAALRADSTIATTIRVSRLMGCLPEPRCRTDGDRRSAAVAGTPCGTVASRLAYLCWLLEVQEGS